LGFRLKGRLLLLGIGLLVLAMFLVNVDGPRSGIIELSAVGRLRTLNKGMTDYKAQHQSYPERLPQVSSNWYTEKYYRFELAPSGATDGSIVDYLIQATPRHSPCLATRSFAIASDGRIFYTQEPRAATAKDQLLQ
jgi:hypothetical protein